MNRPVPESPKIYHIVHIDKLPSIVADSCLWSDAAISQRSAGGSTIGMAKIKERRLNKALTSYPDLHVGECVPFYFCPRSVMLYMLHMDNHPEIHYRGGQQPIIHLMADLHKVIQWAQQQGKRWVVTDANAGSFYFNDYAHLDDLQQIDWQAVASTHWVQCRDKKQAEFLLEQQLPWQLIEGIGVYSQPYAAQVQAILSGANHFPPVKVKRSWYY